jgi:hypothetical protein
VFPGLLAEPLDVPMHVIRSKRQKLHYPDRQDECAYKCITHAWAAKVKRIALGVLTAHLTRLTCM